MPNPSIPEFTVRTPRMTLRPIRAEDCAAFVHMHEISRDFIDPWMATHKDCETLEQLFEFQLQRSLEGFANGKDLRLAGFEVERLVGMFNLNEIIHGAFQNAYAGWKVSVEVAHQGYGTEGVTALLDVAFAAPPLGLGLHRVQANIIPRNYRSIGLAEKVGFRREGLARSYLRIAGRWQDHLMYAKLAEEHVLSKRET
jgi:ribosomal-protein-alanine N-acetyltransferase